VKDVANAILVAVMDPETMGKIYHLGGPKVVTLAELLMLIYELIISSSNTIDLPLPLAKFYGYVLEKFPRRFRLLSRDMVIQMKSNWVVPHSTRTEKILTLADLDLEPHTFEETIPSILLVYRRNRQDMDEKPTFGN